MSIDVALEQLAGETARFGAAAFLLTVREGVRPHVVSVRPRWDDDALVVEVGSRSAANAAAHPQVTVLWPGPDEEGFSLVVDGRATTSGDAAGGGASVVRISPGKAVLHRARAVVEPGASGSDCRTIL